MAIASCFFCVPTPNTSISDSNLTWPHLASFPRLSSSSFTGVISAKSVSFNRRVSISPVFSASIDNGGSDNNGGGLGGGGGGGDGGKNNGDGEGGEDRNRNRNEAMLLLTESGTGLESLPKDLAAAIESGRIPGSVITRFLELQKSAVMRWLMQFAGFRERLLADDLFLAKLAMECGVGIFTKTAAEYERRRENFFNELEVVCADVAMAIIADFMLVYLPAPTVSLRPPLALTAGGISKFFHNCPDNAFQIALSGTSYTLLQRLGAITVMDKAQNGKDVSNVAQEACEKWRLRGNNAYKIGDLSRAEESYTQGIDSVPRIETSRNCLRALMLCYSNRAATRMALGRMREAIADCTMASSIDSNFLKVQVRAGNCYLSLGEIEDASRFFKKCLQSGSDICVDRKIVVEASEGLQKAQRVSECMHEVTRRLQLRTSTDVEKALEILEESLLISSYSEKLLTMKGEALLMLEKYEAAIKLCEQTFDLAGKNSLPDSHDTPKDISFRIWLCHLMLKSYFYMGKLEEAIASLEKQEQLLSATKRDGNKTLESSIPLVGTIRELLRLKSAGNEAFQSGRHTEAVEHYTAALACNVESRPFTAVCFCNRAAAYKALGQFSDAIADCSLAIALDKNYLKAISRRASLFEMIRDYGQAASDMERYVNILTRQMEEKTSGIHDRFTSMANDIRQARIRLSELEEKSRKENSLDMYLVLGVVSSCSASDIRKAYRKAALKHHPDKAGQSLTRNETKDERLWKEIGEEVRRDTDKLFKMIGEAYAVLSDPAKRSQYDLEEEMHNAQKRREGSSTSGADTDVNYPFNSSRRNWREGWSSRRDPSATRWFDPNRSNRYPL